MEDRIGNGVEPRRTRRTRSHQREQACLGPLQELPSQRFPFFLVLRTREHRRRNQWSSRIRGVNTKRERFFSCLIPVHEVILAEWNSAFSAFFAVQIRCSVSVLSPQLIVDRQWLLVLRPQGSSVRS